MPNTPTNGADVLVYDELNNQTLSTLGGDDLVVANTIDNSRIRLGMATTHLRLA